MPPLKRGVSGIGKRRKRSQMKEFLVSPANPAVPPRSDPHPDNPSDSRNGDSLKAAQAGEVVTSDFVSQVNRESTFVDPNVLSSSGGRHWNCFVAGCSNSYYTARKEIQTVGHTSLKYYRIPTKHLDYYNSFFKTDQVNWKNALICNQHWSKGRNNSNDLPDRRLPGEVIQTKKRPHPYNRISKKIGKTCMKIQANSKRLVAKKNNVINEQSEQLKHTRVENEELKRKLLELERKNTELKENQLETKKQLNECKQNLHKLEHMISQMPIFSWDQVQDKFFKYMTGMEKKEFDCLFEIYTPYLHLIEYQGCKGRTKSKISKKNELFAVLVIMRHGIEQTFISWLLKLSASTMSRIFVAWVTFSVALFSKINLAHPKDFIHVKMPQVFKDSGHENVTLILDATEFKLSRFSDLKMNSLFYSDYKSTHTAKALIGITPHGSLTHASDLYPGSISDNDITILTGALDLVNKEDAVLADKGFSVAEEAAERGAVLNRPPMAHTDQFLPGECDENFTVANLRIHVERWIGRMREWVILNKVWPANRMDLLNMVFKFIANLVNLLQVIGPKKPKQ